MRSRSRVFAGLVVGLVAGVLGPSLVAVATHSGNEPAVARVNETSSIRRGAWLSRNENIPGGQRKLNLYVWIEDYADTAASDASQRVDRGAHGEAVASVSTCKPTCTTKTWRAPICPGSGPVFVSSPDLRSAALSGTLTSSSSACTLSLIWADPDPRTAEPQAVRANPTGDSVPGTAGLEGALILKRYARPLTMDVSCWSGTIGGGEIWSALEADASVSRLTP